jgi:ketosteroid isomerase-like protein
MKIRRKFLGVLILAAAGLGSTAWGQMLTPQAPASTMNPLDPTMKPGKAVLLDLEAKFAKDVAERGGEGFTAWFAEDGVSMSNGAAPLIGKVAIARSAKWDPKVYQLTCGDMGYTWGHYEGKSKDANGNPVLTAGRYMTIWRKGSDGSWKVVLDAGANDVPEGGDCCKLPN